MPKTTKNWPVIGFGSGCICLFLGVVFTCELLEEWKVLGAPPAATRKLESRQERETRHTLVAREKWTPETYFQSPEAVLACKAIFSRDNAELRKRIAGGLDVNTTGKAGLTLLHWAFAIGRLHLNSCSA